MLEKIRQAVANGSRSYIVEYVNDALAAGISPREILSSGLIEGINSASGRFSDQSDLAGLLLCSKCVSMGLDVLSPYLTASGYSHPYKAIIGTVSGDLHDIGKNLVAMLLRAHGIEVIDLGVDVPRKQFVKAVSEHEDVRLVCLSCLLTTSMPEMKRTVASLRAIKPGRKLHIMVGGACITPEFAEEIGADSYTGTALAASTAALDFLKSTEESQL